MPKQRLSGIPRALWQSLAGIVIVLFTLLAPVSVASAHDVLTETNPVDGETVEIMPRVIDLTFSNMPLTIGTMVILQDSGGKDWAAGEVKIVDNTISQSVLPNALGGEYKVIWRVVSSDGHPIEGNFAFAAKSGAAGVSTPQATGAQPISDLPEEQEFADSDTFPVESLLVPGAVLVAVIITWVTRRRWSRESSSNGEQHVNLG